MVIPLKRYWIRILLFLVVIGLLALLLFPDISAFFQANLLLNSLIVFVFVLGLLYNLQQLSALSVEAKWLKAFYNKTKLPSKNLHLLRPLQNFQSEHQDNLTLDAASSQFILDNIDARLEETRDLSRYVIALLVFLGLLGTFWGLLITTSSFSEIFQNSADLGEEGNALSNLFSKLQLPLSGMKTAFATSLFGLSASLILGFIDLQRAQAQNRFVTALEEVLVKLTSLNQASAEAPAAMPISFDQHDKHFQSLIEAVEQNNQLLKQLLDGQKQDIITKESRHKAMLENVKYHNDIMHFLAQEIQKIDASNKTRDQIRVLLERVYGTLKDKQ